MNETIPPIVRRFFKARHSRREIFVREIFSRSEGWRTVNTVHKGNRKRNGPRLTAWPIDTVIVQFSDQQIFADFTRSEIAASERMDWTAAGVPHVQQSFAIVVPQPPPSNQVPPNNQTS